MLQTDPTHIEAINHRGNLIMIIKHILVRLSKANLIMQEIVAQLQNIFKENLLIRTIRTDNSE